MQIASGKVVGGRVELESELPEAIGRCERGATLPLADLLRELRDRE